MKLSHRKMYKLPRSPEEIRINNYNPLLLLLWKANMDLQFVGESTLAIAHYVTGYVTKAEKSNMQELWQEVSSHNSVYSKLWSFGVHSLRSRECGLYEASDLLLGDHLCGKSKTVKWIDVSLPHNRKRRLMNHSKLVEMRERHPNSTDIFEDNLVDTFYPQRPSDMEDVCLYDFVAEYTKCGFDDDGNPVYRKLGKTVLPNHKSYDPKRENEHESYFYSLLLLFVPFRNEADLIQQGENAESAFNRHMADNGALNTHSEKLQKMLEAWESVQKINEATQAEAEDVTDADPLKEDDGPQVLGEATSAMNGVVDLHQGDKNCPSFEELVTSLNTDQARIFQQIKVHLEHQSKHENGECTCTDLTPLHMFVSGVGGTGKSFLIKTVRGLVSQIWQDRADCPVCAVSAPTGLAAFNVGGVTIHRLLQLPIEHEGRPARYWRLGKDALKVMHASLSQLHLLIVDEVSLVSSLNLVYIHLRLEEIVARNQWFGGINVLFVGDILQLPPVNGASVYEKMTNKSVASKLGCMTSVNIWQDCVVYDELTINERQKSDGVFSSMLDEVRRGCPSQKTIEALQDRVITSPVVDKFEELLAAKQSPLCLFPTRKACQEFNLEMLSRLQADTKEIPCVDEVDETTGTFKWNKKATDEMKKLNSDCNLTAGLEAVLQVAIGARVMLRRNIDTAVGLVNGALGTVMSIRTHHITVQFDGMHEPHHVERVKSRFMVLKKIYVQRKQFPLILAFAVTVHKCQGLSLDCAMMDLSNQVFCAGMAYVALSRVRKLENLHLVSFSPQAIKVSTKCLQEINRLRQTYRPDMAQYAVPREEIRVKQIRKRKLSATASVVPVSPKKPKLSKPTQKRKVTLPNRDAQTSRKEKVNKPRNKKIKVTPQASDTLSKSKKRVTGSKNKKVPPSEDTFVHSTAFIPSRYRYNPVTPDWQRQACQQLGLEFVRENGITLGGPNVALCPPTRVHRVEGDGNCLFYSLCYISL